MSGWMKDVKDVESRGQSDVKSKTEESRTTCRFLRRAMRAVYSPRQENEQDWDEEIEKW